MARRGVRRRGTLVEVEREDRRIVEGRVRRDAMSSVTGWGWLEFKVVLVGIFWEDGESEEERVCKQEN
jgi:hypothetical protein